MLLSAASAQSDGSVAAAAAEEFVVSEVHLRVNGDRDIVVTNSYEGISLRSGDTLQVVGITYEYNPFADTHDGVIAFEAYLSRLSESGRSPIDYTTGRFGAPSTPSLVPGEVVSHPGLDGAWTVAAGDNRISISMVRYFGDQSRLEARFAVNVQVDQPDFQHVLVEGESRQRLRAEREVQITGAWMNNGGGTFHNYSELDIYNANDLNTPVWVGVLVGTVGPGETIQGEYINPNESDAFDTRWTPAERGSYVLKFSVDPERAAAESDESNNAAEVYVSVRKAKRGDTQVLNLVPGPDSNDSRPTDDDENEQRERPNPRRPEDELPRRPEDDTERRSRGRVEEREQEEERERANERERAEERERERAQREREERAEEREREERRERGESRGRERHARRVDFRAIADASS